MVRNWEIIREVLITLESGSSPDCYINASSFDKFPEQEVAYNMLLLRDGGYIEAKISFSNTGDGKIGIALANRLTSSGHDLLDTIRNDSVWHKLKEKFESKGVEMTFDLVISAGKKIVEAMLS